MIDPDELIELLTNPEFQRKLASAQIVASMGPTLSASADFKKGQVKG